MNRFLVALGGIALLSTPLHAADQSRQVVVGDLDLSTAKGQKILDKRILAAARDICNANATTTGSRVRSQEGLDCVRDTMAKTRAKLALAKAEPARTPGSR